MLYWHKFDTLIDLGLMNLAEKNLAECVETFGEHPMLLQRLALVNLVKGKVEAARIYLERVAKDAVLQPLGGGLPDASGGRPDAGRGCPDAAVARPVSPAGLGRGLLCGRADARRPLAEQGPAEPDGVRVPDGVVPGEQAVEQGSPRTSDG